MNKNTIYLILQGRLGNQLFQYALARKIQLTHPDIDRIVVDDSRILELGWEDSLQSYALPSVEYIHKNIVGFNRPFSYQFWIRSFYKLITRHTDFNKKYKIESYLNKYIGKLGMFLCENGYMDYDIDMKRPIYLEGFFQSEKYFPELENDLRYLLADMQYDALKNYPNINQLDERNSVCISIKVEHNIGSSLYDVCSIDYWRNAIDYIIANVPNPLFFICSDNVDYVLNHLIDGKKYEYVVQDKNSPIHLSLAAMSRCKHFIIGNTTFGWWAQYLSANNNKIVVAPSRWMAIDMPIDIYQDYWHLIEV